MIKIEFKEVQHGILHFQFDEIGLRLCRLFPDKVKSITPYIPTQDPMLDRSHILSLLNISEQEDKLFQEQYKNV